MSESNADAACHVVLSLLRAVDNITTRIVSHISLTPQRPEKEEDIWAVDGGRCRL